MATTLTSIQWTEILQDDSVTKPIDLSIFQTLYSFEGYMAYASQIGRILGYSGKAPHAVVNLEVGNYAKRIAKHYNIKFTKRSQQNYIYWDLFFEGWNDAKFFVWQLRPELIEALENTGLTGDEPLPDEIPLNKEERLFEGAKRTITVNAYERNSKARELCIKHYGTACIICGFDFEMKFGEHGKGFIHVHHLTPLAEIGEHYEVDPIKELRPVCPNCHAMLHRDEPPLTIDELKYLLLE